MKRGGRLNQRSTRKVQGDAVYAKNREERRFQCRDLCEVNGPACPSGAHRGEVCHHVNRRRGPDPHNIENLRWCCNAAHVHLHANPAWAYDQGLLVRSTADL